MVIRVNKTVLYWFFIVLIEVIAVLVIANPLSINHLGPAPITMNEQEASLVVSAIDLVLVDIDKGRLTSTGEALEALRAELPLSVRDAILDQVGEPSFPKLPARLTSVADQLR